MNNISKDRNRTYWPWFLLIAVSFGAVPWIVYGFTWPLTLGFFCGAVATKWFIFSIFDWKIQELEADIERQGDEDE